MDPLHDLCLTCLSKPNLPRKLDDIIMENFKIMEILQKLIPNFMENQEIPLPNCICHECLGKLMTSYTFQKQCLDSIENLHKMWKTTFQEQIVKQEIEEIVLNKTEDMIEDDIVQNEENPLEDVTMDSLDDKQSITKDLMEDTRDSFNHKANENEMLLKVPEEDDNDDELSDEVETNNKEG